MNVPRYLALSFIAIVVGGESLMGDPALPMLQLWSFSSALVQGLWATVVWGAIAAATIAIGRTWRPLAVAAATFTVGLAAECSNAAFLHFFSYTAAWARLGIPTSIVPLLAAGMFEANLLCYLVSRQDST